MLQPKVPLNDDDLRWYYNQSSDCGNDYLNAEWGEYKECLTGSFTKGINIGVHDDWGWPNMKNNYPDYTVANIVNIKAHCTEYLDDGTGSAIFEGDNPTDYDKQLYVL